MNIFGFNHLVEYLCWVFSEYLCLITLLFGAFGLDARGSGCTSDDTNTSYGLTKEIRCGLWSFKFSFRYSGYRHF